MDKPSKKLYFEVFKLYESHGIDIAKARKELLLQKKDWPNINALPSIRDWTLGYDYLPCIQANQHPGKYPEIDKICESEALNNTGPIDLMVCIDDMRMNPKRSLRMLKSYLKNKKGKK